MNLYYREYLGTPCHDKYKVLTELAEAYHAITDSFDKQVCSYEVNGVSMPADAEQRRAINSNALETLQKLAAKAEAAGYTKYDLLDAIGSSRKWRP
jgi:hypothetical protein